METGKIQEKAIIDGSREFLSKALRQQMLFYNTILLLLGDECLVKSTKIM